MAASVSIGIMKRDIQVEDSPYEAGLRYDETLRRYAKLGWKVDLPKEAKAGEKMLNIRLLDGKGRPIEDAGVNCLINRCELSDVVSTTCGHTVDGYYKCPVDFDGPGCRDVRVNVGRAADNMVFDEKIIVEK